MRERIVTKRADHAERVAPSSRSTFSSGTRAHPAASQAKGSHEKSRRGRRRTLAPAMPNTLAAALDIFPGPGAGTRPGTPGPNGARTRSSSMPTTATATWGAVAGWQRGFEDTGLKQRGVGRAHGIGPAPRPSRPLRFLGRTLYAVRRAELVLDRVPVDVERRAVGRVGRAVVAHVSVGESERPRFPDYRRKQA
jgi:hypothetical protein